MKDLPDDKIDSITSMPSSKDDKIKMHIGVGIGIGLGIPLVTTLGLLILEWRKRLGLEKQLATTQGAEKTSYGQS